MIEVEVKIRVDGLLPIRQNLIEKKAQSTGTVRERDVYFNAPHRDFEKTDEALRVRYTDKDCAMTYKGPKQPGTGSKVREEVSVDLSSGESAETILEHLGFVRVAEVNKTREYFKYGQLLVSLDQVEGLGEFVEIEMMASGQYKEAAEMVEKGIDELRIEGERIPLSYLEQILIRR
jgi:adenylate cyclase, class 2